MRRKGETSWRSVAQVAACALLGLGGLLFASASRVPASKASTAASNQRKAVQTIPAGTRVAEDPGKKGDTYYWFESQTARLKARFADATVTTEHGIGGELRAKVHDLHGNETATFIARSSTIQYIPTAGQPFQAVNDSGERPTLDWTAQQAYALSKGGTANVEWKNGMIRAKDNDARHELPELDTEWSNGLTAKATRKAVGRQEIAPGRFVEGEVFKTRLFQRGLEVGHAWWFVRDHVFVWDIPGLTKGWFGPEHLKAAYGGWPFTPDVAWLNLQVIAFHHFYTLIKANGFVAARDVNPQRGWTDRVVNFLVPTLSANEPGCDGLHWLDGTIYRACCDLHDYCYAKNGCSATTWWTVWTSWRCDMCNLVVIDCFAGGGLGYFIKI